MLKDLLGELFGVTLHGLMFERVLWTALAAWMGWSVYSGWKKKEGQGSLLVSGSIGLYAAYMAASAWLKGSYQLFFQEPLVLHTYGVAIAVGFMVAIGTAHQQAVRTGFDGRRVFDLAFWILISSMLGSRILYMVVNWQTYYNRCFEPAAEGLSAPDCVAVLRLWEGGLVFYGGLLGAMIAGVIFLKKTKLNVWAHADMAGLGVPLGQFFGRLGCVAAGCCHGHYLDSHHPLALHWPKDTAAYDVILKDTAVPAAEHDLFLHDGFVSAHPTQLYESGAMLLVYILLLVLQKYKRFHGQVFLAYVLGYAAVRFSVEFFRGDRIRGVYELVGGVALSTSQIVALLMFLGALGFGAYRLKQLGSLPKVPTAP